MKNYPIIISVVYRIMTAFLILFENQWSRISNIFNNTKMFCEIGLRDKTPVLVVLVVSCNLDVWLPSLLEVKVSMVVMLVMDGKNLEAPLDTSRNIIEYSLFIPFEYYVIFVYILEYVIFYYTNVFSQTTSTNVFYLWFVYLKLLQ